MRDRVAIIEGIRTPFCKAGGALKEMEADDIGAYAIRELLERIPVDRATIDEVILGNVIQPPHATNIARVAAVKGGMAETIPAFTVNRNCASGLESIIVGAMKIQEKHAESIIAGGTESMSNFPILFRREMREFMTRFSKAKTIGQRIRTAFSFRPSFLVPEIPGIADPLCGLVMGQTAENLVRDFHVSREEQDEFGVMSHQRAEAARKEGRFAEEIAPIPVPPKFNRYQEEDDGIREGQTMEQMAKLKPAFDKLAGSVTAGTSSQVTDGACAVLLMSESRAKEQGLKPLGYIRDYAYAALDPSRMGLGPVFAVSKLLDQTGFQLSDFNLVEINEAFAAQVIAVEKAMASKTFCKERLGRDRAIGELDRDKLNVNGGAIALGHPIGVSGARMVLTILKELRRRNQNLGLVTMCVGGGQGEAAVVEVD